jgi:hypothetical protein
MELVGLETIFVRTKIMPSTQAGIGNTNSVTRAVGKLKTNNIEMHITAPEAPNMLPLLLNAYSFNNHTAPQMITDTR